MMTRKNLLLLLAVAALTVLPLLMTHQVKEGEEAFAGADGQAEKVIAELRADYVPWFKPLWEPPSGEIESLLFALQAALGAGLVGYCLGYFRGRRAGSEERKA